MNTASTLGRPVLPLRAGHLALADLIDLYMAQYEGRDNTRAQRLDWWRVHLGHLTLAEVTDDHIHAALEHLAHNPPVYFAGLDAQGKRIFKAKRKTLVPATVNRYSAAIGSVFTWGQHRRIAPVGWVHPCRAVARRKEDNEKTRFLSNDERARLLAACKASKWRPLYVLVLLALTTGARKGELMGLRWADVDLQLRVIHVGRSKNGDPKVLPVVPAAAEVLQTMVGKPAALVFASKEVPEKAFSFEPRFQQALKAAHIRSFRFHDCRHSCASFLAQHGATLLAIADLLGHRQMSMTKRYSHLASSHRSELVNRVMGDMR